MSKILVVDNNESLLVLYHKELSEEGYKVILASNGKQAVKKTITENPDLIIMDIRMKGMDGIEAMGEILARNRRAPIILNTAYSIYKNNFLTWPAEAYVVKSSDLSELKNTIIEVLNKGLFTRHISRNNTFSF